MSENFDLKELQEKILEIVEYFDRLCNKNGITYYLMGGSALGAIRHLGFIPWDDDFDVFMDYENYTKFIKIIDDKLDKNLFYFQHEDSNEWPLFFSKIRMNNTTFIEKNLKNRDMHHGIYIDIMCLNNTSKYMPIRYLQYFAARLLTAKALGKQNYTTENIPKRVILFFSKFFINDFIKVQLLKFIRSFNQKDTGMVGHFFGRAPFKKTSFDISYLGKPRYVEFENFQLPVPRYVERYLEVRFGNRYMEIPSEKEKMKYPTHAYIVDTNKSYEHYILS